MAFCMARGIPVYHANKGILATDGEVAANFATIVSGRQIIVGSVDGAIYKDTTYSVPVRGY